MGADLPPQLPNDLEQCHALIQAQSETIQQLSPAWTIWCGVSSAHARNVLIPTSYNSSKTPQRLRFPIQRRLRKKRNPPLNEKATAAGLYPRTCPTGA